MLRRVTEHDDPELLRVLPLQPRLEEQPRTGAGLPSLRIGRHPNNDVVLTSAGIPLLLSRQHALVTYDGEQFTLVDLDTTNGTYVRAPRSGTAAHRVSASAARCSGKSSSGPHDGTVWAPARRGRPHGEPARARRLGAASCAAARRLQRCAGVAGAGRQ
jgi:hypothetical protein